MLVLVSFINQSFINIEREKHKEREKKNEYYLVVVLQLLLTRENTHTYINKYFVFQIAGNKNVIRRREKRQHLTSVIEREDFVVFLIVFEKEKPRAYRLSAVKLSQWQKEVIICHRAVIMVIGCSSSSHNNKVFESIYYLNEFFFIGF
jgi:hypothetical protein